MSKPCWTRRPKLSVPNPPKHPDPTRARTAISVRGTTGEIAIDFVTTVVTASAIASEEVVVAIGAEGTEMATGRRT